jgi:cell division protein FtsW (lipid II flippase)
VGVTYTRGADLQRRRTQRVAISLGEHLLVVTSVVVVLAVALAYLGRTRAETLGPSAAAIPINLNGGPDAAALEAPLAAAFAYPGDRRLAARLIATRPAGSLPNVGALASLTVPADTIARDRSVVVFRERLAGAERSAQAAGREPPRTIPLLTGADLSSLKPGVVVRTSDEFRTSVIWCVVAMLLGFHGVSLLWRVRGVAGDRVLLALAHLLVGLGFVMMLTRPDPLRDTFLLSRYSQGVVIALAVFSALSLVNLDRPAVRELSYVPLALALLLSLLLIVFGSGPGSSQAKVNLGPIQPIEAIRLLMALFLAGFFARRWELIRQAHSGVNVPRLAHVLPVVAGVGAALVLFFFQKDLGPALLLSLMFLSLFAVARGGGWIAGAGLATLVAGFGAGYLLNISNTLAARVAMWQSPWDNAVRGGDQIAQAMWGLAAGAASGTGAGLGQTRYVPESHTDLVLAAIGEELGFIGLLVVGVAFFLIVWRGLAIARRASSDYRFFLALALTLSLAVPVLVMAAGTLGLLPLTGVVTPFPATAGRRWWRTSRCWACSSPSIATNTRLPTWRRFRFPCGGSAAWPWQVPLLQSRWPRPCRRFAPMTTSFVRSSDFRPMAAGGFSTTRACSRCCGPFRAGRFMTGAACPSRATTSRCWRRRRRNSNGLGGSCQMPARRHRIAATRRGRRCFTCWAMRTRAPIGARPTARTWSATPRTCCADSTIARRPWRPPIVMAGPHWPSAATTPRWSRWSVIATNRIIPM